MVLKKNKNENDTVDNNDTIYEGQVKYGLQNKEIISLTGKTWKTIYEMIENEYFQESEVFTKVIYQIL